MTTAAQTTTTAAVPFTRLLGRWLIAAAVAAVVNIVIGQLAQLLGAAKIMALTPPPIIVFCLVGLLGATLVYALIQRFAKNPVRIFRIVAGVVLLISFVPDLLLLNAPAAMLTGDPNGTLTGSLGLSIAALILMHIVAAASAVWQLTRS